jgi:predicted GNAT family acetyltransferase
MTDEPTVTRNDETSRYEIRLGEVLAGFAEYKERDGEILFVHTEVDPAFQGKGHPVPRSSPIARTSRGI